MEQEDKTWNLSRKRQEFSHPKVGRTSFPKSISKWQGEIIPIRPSDLPDVLHFCPLHMDAVTSPSLSNSLIIDLSQWLSWKNLRTDAYNPLWARGMRSGLKNCEPTALEQSCVKVEITTGRNTSSMTGEHAEKPQLKKMKWCLYSQQNQVLITLDFELIQRTSSLQPQDFLEKVWLIFVITRKTGKQRKIERIISLKFPSKSLVVPGFWSPGLLLVNSVWIQVSLCSEMLAPNIIPIQCKKSSSYQFIFNVVTWLSSQQDS